MKTSPRLSPAPPSSVSSPVARPSGPELLDPELRQGACRPRKQEIASPEDTTASGSGFLLTPGFLRFAGELLFGKRWQTPLAETLGAFRGKPLSPATVHQWSTRTRSIPAWVEDALFEALDSAERDMLLRAETARSVKERMCRAGRSPSRTTNFRHSVRPVGVTEA